MFAWAATVGAPASGVVAARRRSIYLSEHIKCWPHPWADVFCRFNRSPNFRLSMRAKVPCHSSSPIYYLNIARRVFPIHFYFYIYIYARPLFRLSRKRLKFWLFLGGGPRARTRNIVSRPALGLGLTLWPFHVAFLHWSRGPYWCERQVYRETPSEPVAILYLELLNHNANNK